MQIKKPPAKEACEPDWIRTNDPKLRRFVLYPAELPVPNWSRKITEKTGANQELAD